MKNKFSLLYKIFKTFGFYSSVRFIIAHIFKMESVYVFIRELDRKIVMRPWTGDFATLRRVIWDKEYEFELNDVKSVVDLGANIGISTIMLANKFPNAKIIALEPEMYNFQLLRMNVKGLSNISILNNAIWYKDGTVEIINFDVKSNEFKCANSNGSSNSQQIESISIPTLMHRYNLKTIDLLKVDVEGAEEELFAKGNLDWIVKTNCCIIEIHSPNFQSDLLEIMGNKFSHTVKGEKILFTRSQ